MPSLQNKGLQSLVFNLRLMKNYLVLGGLVLVLAFSSCWVHIWQTCYPGSNPSYYTQTMDIYSQRCMGRNLQQIFYIAFLLNHHQKQI